MRALDRKLLRDLAHLKGQVLTIALVVAAGFTAFAGVRSAYAALEHSRDAFYDRYHFADVFARLKRAPDAIEARVARLPGVAQAHGRIVEEVMMPMPDMVELFVAAPDGAIWAIGSRGRLLRADPGDWAWSSPLPPDAGVAVKSVAFG